MPHSLSAVIFDCDGILVDTEPVHYRAFQEALKPFDLEFDYAEYVRLYIGFDDRDAFGEVFKNSGRTLQPSVLHELMDTKARALQRIIAKGVPTFPGVLELVQELQVLKVPLAVASGALHHEVDAFMRALGIREVFPVIVGADDVTRSKPDPETYQTALERLRDHLGLTELIPRECVAIEDTPTGILSARSAGLFVVGVGHSYPLQDLGESHRAVQSMLEVSAARLKQWLGSLCH